MIFRTSPLRRMFCSPTNSLATWWMCLRWTRGSMRTSSWIPTPPSPAPSALWPRRDWVTYRPTLSSTCSCSNLLSLASRVATLSGQGTSSANTSAQWLWQSLLRFVKCLYRPKYICSCKHWMKVSFEMFDEWMKLFLYVIYYRVDLPLSRGVDSLFSWSLWYLYSVNPIYRPSHKCLPFMRSWEISLVTFCHSWPQCKCGVTNQWLLIFCNIL